ncbi:Crp/Fnr family transcriptional regulator [Kitasatospora purpeofusca]|uniref:Crp/Fnr family transcriptional regulator n=1 Tax=Kitasatospora purpeofusca TaxID=67352 RepID=UPI0035DFEE25
MNHSTNTNGRSPFLHSLSDEARTALEQVGARRRFAAGDVLINEGDRAHDLVVLHLGVVKVTGRLDGDRTSLMDIRIAGDVVGEVAALDLGPRTATVTACGDVVATVVPGAELPTLTRTVPEMFRALSQVVCDRLRRSDRLRLEFGGYPVPVRLARVLVELAESYGRRERNAVRIDVNLSQPELAALIGSTAHTVHPSLARLRRAKLITTGTRQTYVRDLDRLRQVARLDSPAA